MDLLTDTENIIENGIIKQMRADWLLPNNTKLEVTLKVLNSKDHLNVTFSTTSFFVSIIESNGLCSISRNL